MKPLMAMTTRVGSGSSMSIEVKLNTSFGITNIINTVTTTTVITSIMIG